MSGIYKFSKISMVLGLLCADSSWVHAMDPDDDLERAIKLSLTPAQEVQKDLPKGHIVFEGSDEDLAACIAAQQELYAQKRAKPKAVVQPKKHVNHDLGMDTTGMTEGEIWALIQAQQDPMQPASAVAPARNNPFIVQEDEITPEQWAIIKQQAFEAEKASKTIWTRDPGRKVPASHSQYRLRADNMPDSQINGEHQNIQSKGLGSFVHGLENRINHNEGGVQEWEKSAAKREEQRQFRQVVSSSYSDAEKAREQARRQAEVKQQQQIQEERLRAMAALEKAKQQQPQVDVKVNDSPFGPKVAVKKVSPKEEARLNPVVNEQPTDVKDIADRFGGRGGFKNPAKK